MISHLRKNGIALAIFTIFLLVTGCASIVSRSRYPIYINSNPERSHITVRDKKNREIFTGLAPATVDLKAGAGFFSRANYTIEFEMPDYHTKIVAIEAKLDGWYFGNIIFGGVIGLLIVDPASGAMWKLDQEFVVETLYKVTASTDEPALNIYDYNSIPENWKEHMVRIDE